MKKHFMVTLFLITSLFILSACSSSFDKEQKEAKVSVEEAFKEKPNKTNNQNKDIEFYIPFGFEIEEKTENNIILKNGSKTYILFYNQHESYDSKVVYESTLKQKEKFDVNETFEKDSKFGYLLISKLEDDQNEVTVGIGGIKITSEVKTKSLASEAVIMMNIVNSVKVNKES